MIVDASVLVGYYNQADRRHDECAQAIASSADGLVVSPYVVAETDYLILKYAGVDAEIAALRELSGDAWDLASFAGADLLTALDVIAKYADHRIGVADASLVVLADRYRTRTIATLDRRHFSVLRPLTGGRFRIVP